jgi:sporulation protein YlmC with PRC-barrel domain
LEEKMTASYIIGQPVLNDKNERVAKVNDIIIDKDGDAEMLILGDGNFTGWGKNVAYDFDRIVVKGQDGVVLSNLTEAMIDEAENFSYDQADASDKNTQVISQSSYSLSNLIGHNLTDQKGEVLANIEEVIVNDGEVDGLVVGYNETLGMGGDRAVLSLDDVMLSNHNGEVHAQLSVEKAARFNVFKNKQAESEM